MAISLARAAQATLLYADIFDYPLKLTEIRKYLVYKKCPETDIKKLERVLENSPLVERSGQFYFITGKKKSLEKRIARNRYSLHKLRQAQSLAGRIGRIPFIRMIAVTGAVAAGNAETNDDIDLLLITESNRLWLVRFLCVLYLRIVGKYRKPGESEVNDKFCLNMYLDEDNLTLPKNEQDLYSARELVQLLPVYGKDFTYEKLLTANLWLKNYLPNGINWETFNKQRKERPGSGVKPGFNLLSSLDAYLGSLQKNYMRKRQTREVVREGYLRFHPVDQRVKIMAAYRKRLKGRSLNLFF